MQLNFKKDVSLNKKNFFTTNPLNKSDVKKRKINGKYVYETFYLIDFLDIKDDSYIISSFGRVFSLITNKELQCTIDKCKNNYKSVTLSTNTGKQRKFSVHRLVARAFVPKTTADNKMSRIYVHHKNWDNEYNYYWNLEWRSPMEIMMIGRSQAKNIEEEDLIKIVHILLDNGESVADIFDIIGGKLSKFKISSIKRIYNK